jgi:NAD(P)-dependent dehydrogenase (short-subunit alcohol dehydrogenase family)
MGLQALLNHASRSPAGVVAVTLLLILGAIAALKALVRLASGVYTYFLRPGKDLRRLGQWALVTGATDGIGKAYAAALAKKGACRSPARLLASGGGADARRGEDRGSVRSWELGSSAPPASRSYRARTHSRRLPPSLAVGVSAPEAAQWSGGLLHGACRAQRPAGLAHASQAGRGRRGAGRQVQGADGDGCARLWRRRRRGLGARQGQGAPGSAARPAGRRPRTAPRQHSRPAPACCTQLALAGPAPACRPRRERRGAAQVDALEVGILVNNVGMSYPHAEYFDKIPDDLIDSLIQLNIVSTNKARRPSARAGLPGQRAHRVR